MTDIYDDVKAFWNDDSDRLRTYAHYCAQLGEERWRQVGDNVLKQLESFVELDTNMDVLDYGCGGGAITRALLQHDARPLVYAADISLSALHQTREVAESLDLDHRLELIHVDPAIPYTGIRKHRPYDVIVTSAVFQHFPSQEYASEILEAFAFSSHKQTKAVVQIREDTGDPQFTPKSGDYLSQAITYTSHTKEDFAERCERAGWRVARTAPGPYNYLWFFLE